MGYDVQQSSTDQPLAFLMVDSADHITGKTGLTVTVTIRKVGGSFASPSGAVSEVGNGWYEVAPNATDNNTLGPLLLHATATGADPTDDCYQVVVHNPLNNPALTASGIRSAVGLASANLDTQLAAIDDYVDAEVAAIKAKTDQLTFTVANKVDASATVADKEGYKLAADGFDLVDGSQPADAVADSWSLRDWIAWLGRRFGNETSFQMNEDGATGILYVMADTGTGHLTQQAFTKNTLDQTIGAITA